MSSVSPPFFPPCSTIRDAPWQRCCLSARYHSAVWLTDLPFSRGESVHNGRATITMRHAPGSRLSPHCSSITEQARGVEPAVIYGLLPPRCTYNYLSKAVIVLISHVRYVAVPPPRAHVLSPWRLSRFCRWRTAQVEGHALDCGRCLHMCIGQWDLDGDDHTYFKKI